MSDTKKWSRRQVLQGLGAAGGSRMIYQAMAGLGLTTSLGAQPRVEVEAGVGAGKTVVILGGGVAGLAAAYELLANRSGYECLVLEANARVGGRSLTLRHGDVLEERLEDGQSYRDLPGQNRSRQTCLLEPKEATGWDRPYLNAGPGRLPSAHTLILDLCRKLAVPLEVYVMESRSNFVRGKSGGTFVNRHAANDFRGWVAERLFAQVAQMTDLTEPQRDALRRLLVSFGALGNGLPGGGQLGRFAQNGKYERSTRSGYQRHPGVAPGISVDPIPLATLLEAGLDTTQLYQPEDFLWQPTLFQPIGGMDRIVHALGEAVTRMGGRIRTSAVVRQIGYHAERRKWLVLLEGSTQPIVADVCISNIPIPLLAPRLEPSVPFQPDFRKSLEAVAKTGKFLAPTCKVGWQAKRELWQQPGEGRVSPIFGGISWTSHPLTQLWYPSDRFTDELGVLTGAYNYGANATTWGQHSPAWRLEQARAGAGELGGAAFASGLGKGLSIAWQNMPYQRGGWAQWQEVADGVTHYNQLLQGDMSVGFHVCGDQLSQLPGWKEGAVASAQHVVARLSSRVYAADVVDSVPDSRVLVEGQIPVSVEE